MKHAPLLGYNDNVTHAGRLFHVQTEDSGGRRSNVVTHLFVDGGRIVKSSRTSYADARPKGELADHVRGLMKAQHQAMIDELCSGALDVLIDPPAAPAPEVTAAPAETQRGGSRAAVAVAAEPPFDPDKTSRYVRTPEMDAAFAAMVAARTGATSPRAPAPLERAAAAPERAAAPARPDPRAEPPVRAEIASPASAPRPRKPTPPPSQRKQTGPPAPGPQKPASLRRSGAVPGRRSSAPPARPRTDPPARPRTDPPARPRTDPPAGGRFGDRFITPRPFDQLVLDFLSRRS